MVVIIVRAWPTRGVRPSSYHDGFRGEVTRVKMSTACVLVIRQNDKPQRVRSPRSDPQSNPNMSPEIEVICDYRFGCLECADFGACMLQMCNGTDTQSITSLQGSCMAAAMQTLTTPYMHACEDSCAAPVKGWQRGQALRRQQKRT